MTDIIAARLYLFRNDRGLRAHTKLVRQLQVLQTRIDEGIPRWREAFNDHSDRTGRWIVESTMLRLDFECYIEIFSRFFRLCRDVTGIEAISKEPIVEKIRLARNRIIEHGYDVNREGDRNFFCGDDGPKLVSDQHSTDCPAFGELQKEVGPVLRKYCLTEREFLVRFMAIRGTHIWTDQDDRAIPDWL